MGACPRRNWARPTPSTTAPSLSSPRAQELTCARQSSPFRRVRITGDPDCVSPISAELLLPLPTLSSECPDHVKKQLFPVIWTATVNGTVLGSERIPGQFGRP